MAFKCLVITCIILVFVSSNGALRIYPKSEDGKKFTFNIKTISF